MHKADFWHMYLNKIMDLQQMLSMKAESLVNLKQDIKNLSTKAERSQIERQ
jgi:hypothetical protein